ncbi:protein of unknown function [Blastococcus saxobsidens DD2]|uniref:Uncharacterized protein n=1 Tax=Blastococcus saxobsidens (strain DD2) TaxID=1146883 RepID=H6RLC4_BLASD|nr:protein of unknown function [Blastococcus saxobsidens DD2]
MECVSVPAFCLRGPEARTATLDRQKPIVDLWTEVTTSRSRRAQHSPAYRRPHPTVSLMPAASDLRLDGSATDGRTTSWCR